jgi:hypothetical protein
MTVITVRADPSLLSQDWVVDKSYITAGDTGDVLDCCQDRHRPRMARMTVNEHYTLQTVSEEALHNLTEVFLTLVLTHTRVAPTERWGIRRQYHNRVHLEVGSLARIRRISGPRALNAASCRRRVIAMKPRLSSLIAASDQVIPVQCETVMMAELEAPWNINWAHRTEIGTLPTRKTLHSQDPRPRSPESIRDGPE